MLIKNFNVFTHAYKQRKCNTIESNNSIERHKYFSKIGEEKGKRCKHQNIICKTTQGNLNAMLLNEITRRIFLV